MRRPSPLTWIVLALAACGGTPDADEPETEFVPIGSTSEETGAPEVQPAPTDQCLNEADAAILGADRTTVEEHAVQCARDCIGTEDYTPCVTACVQDRASLSEGCAVCYAEDEACSLEHCALQCMDPTSYGCGPCLEHWCDPDFTACSGLDVYAPSRER